MWSATPKIWKLPLGKPNVNVGPQIGGSKVELRPSKFTAENFRMQDNGFATAFDMLGKVLTLNRVPTRFLTFADRYFKNGEYRSEIYAMAFRETMEKYNAGLLKRENMSAYLADNILHPTTDVQSMAQEAARYITYQTPMGKRGDFLDTAKAAQYLKVSESTLIRYHLDGKLKWITRRNRTPIYKREELDAYKIKANSTK